MAELQPGVRERLNSPTSGEIVTLIVGVTDPTSDDVQEAIEAAGGEIEDQLYYECLAVSIDETDLDALCELDVVTTVEIEGKWESMQEDEGNFRSLLDSDR